MDQRDHQDQEGWVVGRHRPLMPREAQVDVRSADDQVVVVAVEAEGQVERSQEPMVEEDQGVRNPEPTEDQVVP